MCAADVRMAIASHPRPLARSLVYSFIRTYAESVGLLGRSEGARSPAHLLPGYTTNPFPFCSHPDPHATIAHMCHAERAVLDIERAALTEASVPAILKQQALRSQRLEAHGAFIGRF